MIVKFVSILAAVFAVSTSHATVTPNDGRVDIWPVIPFVRGADLCRFTDSYGQTRMQYLNQMMKLAGGRDSAGAGALVAFNDLYEKNMALATQTSFEVTLEATLKSYTDSYFRSLQPKVKKLSFTGTGDILSVIYVAKTGVVPDIDKATLNRIDYVAYGTYALAPNCQGDIQVTLQLNTINVPATERLNGEAPGQLLQHRFEAPMNSGSREPALPTPVVAKRSVTNLDLENFRRTRMEGERNYDERRKELGLPTIEEQRRNLAAVGERAGEASQNIRADEEQAESYWRNRADALRNEISATNARIDYVQTRLNEIPAYSYGAFGSVLPFATVDQLSIGSPFITGTVGVSVGSQVRGGFGFRNDRFRGRVFVNSGNSRFGRSTFGSPLPFGNLVSVPFQNYDLGYERSQLVAEFDHLMLQRVTLQSHWRDLEDEARKAGAYPGWLRLR